MSAEPHLLTETADGVCTLTLNRPDRLNALSAEMLESLGAELARAEEDPEVRCIVLTGAGRAFCAGGDVQAFAESGGEGGGATEVDPQAVAEQLARQEATVAAMWQSSTPVVAALPGAAAGAGLGLALAADLRVASTQAVLTTAFAKVGLSGDFGVPWLLQRLVGSARATELMLLSPRLDAQTSLELGLVNRVVEPDALAAETTRLARELADGPALAQRHAKANVRAAELSTLTDYMAGEVARHKECGISADHAEAALAFTQKRRPVFGR
ncbi:enoyl-CoA hydratase [Marihabitans asiaticum]|uniref:Enoyl-CoA hydratase n=1 Tax=Marihabitans asiaticum TaxID=415218 RepID=A0A560WHL8_9MICO|nr:enoyl-CoA hydratase-related protein [Marihabitans asiaticum]TWD17167.1 enoyl-CoA hydratase [Marihabitans asiaticum]